MSHMQFSNSVIASEAKQSQSTQLSQSILLRRDRFIPAFFLLSFFFFLSVFTGCDSDTTTTSKTSKETAGKAEVRASSPQFKKEGDLYLVKSAGDTIRRIDIEIADMESERTIGMMHRRNMPDTQGMLFIFEQEKPRSFWMRNTLIGLDILYIRADGEIESIAKYCIPKYDKSIPSRGPALYVLEVIEGCCDIHGVEVGDRIDFKRTDGK